MIAVDTNILVHAHRADSVHHGDAATSVKALAEGTARWAIPWPCVHEFLSIVTHPRIWRPPSTIDQATEQIARWVESPSLVLIGEGAGYLPRLAALLKAGKVAGPRVHDARIAALCVLHGVAELWTADRDFSRFPTLTTRNPLVGG